MREWWWLTTMSTMYGAIQYIVLIAYARMVVAYDNEHYVLDSTVDLYDVENQRRNNIFADGEGICTFIPEKPGLVLLFVTIHENIGNNRWESHNNSLTLEVKRP